MHMDVKPLKEIKDRRDFEDAFQSAMSGAHQTLRTLWHFEKEQNLPKSYLIEFHPKEDDCSTHDWTTETVFSALQQVGRNCSAIVSRTEDESLLFLSHQEPENKADFIIDCLHPRFLIFHTLSNANSTDRFIFKRLTQYQPEFDLFWFPVSLLEGVKDREQVTGWEAIFSPLLDTGEVIEDTSQVEGEDIEEDIDEEANELPARVLSQPRLLSLVQPNALDTYQRLKDLPDLFPDVPLNDVFAERHDEQLSTYARARIKSVGKVTGRGSDFSAYLQIVNGTLDSYAEAIGYLESKYWIKPQLSNQKGSTGFSIAGEPFCIKFSREIKLDKLLRLMFYCEPPFRLMGEPERLKEDYFTVDAIDLHINQPLAFEITRRFMRVYLYEGTCGNTLVRIVRSLQHHIDSKLQHPSLLAVT